MPYTSEKILPAPMLDLKINLGDGIRSSAISHPEKAEIYTKSWFVGIWNTCHIVEWPQNLQFYGLFLKPGSSYPFLRLPASELHNRVISLETIWGRFANDLRERLYNAPTIEMGLALLEQALLERLHEAPSGLKIVKYALTELAHWHGTVSIQALCANIGISQNYLGQLFKTLVGGTPKEIARLYRFQHVLDSIDPTQPTDWTSVAHEFLYYDQSHFNKEFGAFTGDSPTDYVRLRRKVQIENPQHAGYLRQLPIE